MHATWPAPSFYLMLHKTHKYKQIHLQLHKHKPCSFVLHTYRHIHTYTYMHTHMHTHTHLAKKIRAFSHNTTGILTKHHEASAAIEPVTDNMHLPHAATFSSKKGFVYFSFFFWGGRGETLEIRGLQAPWQGMMEDVASITIFRR